MRKVFPNDMVAHLWANQAQEEARSSNGNFYFRGDIIYSYGSHFPIAQHVTGADGTRAILFTTRDYSATTTAHKTTVRRAISEHVKLFTVALIKRNPYGDEIDHSYSIRHYTKHIAECVDKAKKARGAAAYWAERARGTVEQANEYAAFFGLQDRFALPEDFEAIERRAQEKAVAHNARQEERNRVQRARWERERAEDAKRREALIPQWRAGENVYIGRTEKCLLRVKDDTLQTSWGAEVPLDHAVKAFKIIAHCKAAASEYRRNGHTVHVGHFAVDRIEPNGTLHAGCHVIEWDEIERIATALGVLESA
jgi:hypothetical protein